MTAIEAKELSLEVWGYLKDHPEIAYKGCIPTYLFEKIRDMYFCCPLCEYFDGDCYECPLGNCSGGSLYAEYNRDELFWDKKSVQLSFGIFGCRKSTSISVKVSTLELLKKMGLDISCA